ncbi:LacI family DNA-binding transcriptional regulator [Streptomyces canus]|uniref:LacI family DNA-binding transcriptional regulator n=1 Tax=Streptomyces canus TaxID=58343 RepID=UPI00371A2019
MAAETGVSATTVSKVIHECPGGSESTRQRVLEVAKRLDYTPQHPQVKRGRTGFVGLLTLDPAGQYSLEIMHGMKITDDERELLLDASLDAIRERDRIPLFADGLVDDEMACPE